MRHADAHNCVTATASLNITDKWSRLPDPEVVPFARPLTGGRGVRCRPTPRSRRRAARSRNREIKPIARGSRLSVRDVRRDSAVMWIPGRHTKVGVALTFAGMFLVLATWESGYSHGHGWSFPNEVVLWLTFPLCGLFLGWSLKLSAGGLVLLFISMIMHWVAIGLLLDRALARRARERIGSPPNMPQEPSSRD